jgi:hypothetical protein
MLAICVRCVISTTAGVVLCRSRIFSSIRNTFFPRRHRWKERGVEVERTLRTEELAGDVEGLTSHNDDLLAVEQLLGDSAGQTTKEVSLAVDDDLIHD